MADIQPSSMASQLATAYTQPMQSLLTAKTKNAQNMSSALSKLQSVLGGFNTALAGLSSGQKMAQNATAFSSTGYATASATGAAQAGSYSLWIQQVATAHQIAFEDLPAVPVALGGPLVVRLDDGSNFLVDLPAADQDSNGTISQSEIARAINQASGNQGKVTATTITAGGTTQLVLTSGQTGAAGRITLDTTGLPASTLKTALDTPKELTVAQDAIAQISGMPIQQGSNTINAIDGVSITLTKAMQVGDPSTTLTVSSDASGTSANVRKFIDAYNTLNSALDELTANGGEGKTRATLASDAGVRALRNRLQDALRKTYGTVRLADLGVSADRNGKLSLNETKLQSTLALKPDALDQAFGSASLTSPTGALGTFQTVVKTWTSSTGGQIKDRQDALQSLQKDLTNRQARLDTQYTQVYNRYLAQFTQLQSLQSRMTDTYGILSQLSPS